MNKIICIACLLLASLLCKSQSDSTETMFARNFIPRHAGWKLSKDTIRIDTIIGFKDIRQPVRLNWLTAIDSNGCLRIAYFKLESKKSKSNIKIGNIKITRTACSVKPKGKEKRRFESLAFSGTYTSFDGARGITIGGELGSVKGNGQYTIKKYSKTK